MDAARPSWSPRCSPCSPWSCSPPASPRSWRSTLPHQPARRAGHGRPRAAPAAATTTTGRPAAGRRRPTARPDGPPRGWRRLPAPGGDRRDGRPRATRPATPLAAEDTSLDTGAGQRPSCAPASGSSRRRWTWATSWAAGGSSPPVSHRPRRHRRTRAADRPAATTRSQRLALIVAVRHRLRAGPGRRRRGLAGPQHPARRCGRVAATATRVSHLPLDSGEVALAERVPAADTDPRTEVGQVGLGAQQHARPRRRRAARRGTRARCGCASSSPTPATSCARPLASIRGYAELSRREREPVPPTVTHALGRVESEATRMAVLVDDLLLLARLDAGRPLDQEPVDLTRIVVDAVSDAHAAGPDHIWQLDLPDESGRGPRRPGAAAPGGGQPAGQRPHPHARRHDGQRAGPARRRRGARSASTTTAPASRRRCSPTSSTGSPAATAHAPGPRAAPGWG